MTRVILLKYKVDHIITSSSKNFQKIFTGPNFLAWYLKFFTLCRSISLSAQSPFCFISLLIPSCTPFLSRHSEYTMAHTPPGASQMALVVKNLLANTRDIRDAGSIPGSGRSSGGGHGNPLQYSYLENPMDKEACQAMVHRVAKSQTQMKQSSLHAHAPLCSLVSLGTCLKSLMRGARKIKRVELLFGNNQAL